jgi:hypothetical protein
MFPWHLELGFLNRPWMEGLYFAISIIVAWWVAVQVMKQHKMDLKKRGKAVGLGCGFGFLGSPDQPLHFLVSRTLDRVSQFGRRWF